MAKDKTNGAAHEQAETEKELTEKQCSQECQEKEPVSQEEESFKLQFLRLNADFQNFKRRIDKERIEWMMLAQSKMLENILPIFDELDRALKLADEKSDDQHKAWLDGFKLIQKNWQKKFKELGAEEIDGSGEFDPELHEALVQVDSDDVESHHIVECFEKGYKFKDKVIKHAKVSVAK